MTMVDAPVAADARTGAARDGLLGRLRADRAVVVRWVADLLAAAPIVTLLLVLSDDDGARGLRAAVVLGAVALAALPAVAAEVRHWPRTAVVLLGCWLAALVLGASFGTYRADMALPLVQYAIAPVLLLATTRLWRRPWAPAGLLLLLVVAFGIHQERAWSVWWAKTETGTAQWAPLSWHNQSAALTGILAVWFLGAGLASTRIMRAGLLLLAASGFAGTWLSGSRGGVMVTAGAAAVAVAVAWRTTRTRGEPTWRPVVALLATGMLAALTVAGLLSMQPAGGNPIADRGVSPVHTGLARVEHSEAALGMWADRPLTGQGPGSYATLARAWNDPSGNLTSSAHDEYAEVAGELGLLGLVALAGVLLGAAVLGLRLLRSPPTTSGPADLRGPVTVGAVGAAALFLVHSGVDFDWHYPLLSGLGAMAVGILVVARSRGPVVRHGAAMPVAAGLAAVLAATVGLAALERTTDGPLPWHDDHWVAVGTAALEDGRVDDALAAARTTLRWNPASYGAAALADRARFARDGDVDALVTASESRPWWFTGRARAALALAGAGHDDAARAMVARLHDDLDDHTAWGVASTRLLTVEAEVAAAAAGSCDAARAVVADALAAAEAGDPGAGLPTIAADILDERLSTEGCADTAG